MTDFDLLRMVRFDGHPGLELTIWDTNRVDRLGKTILRYEFRQAERVLFEGSDFACSPMHAIDSDDTICSLMTFLVLRPGDTDRDYFDQYTPDQLAWTESSECEALACDLSADDPPEGFIFDV